MKILVPTAGATTAAETADYIMGVAMALNADVVVLHIVRPGQATEAGELSLEIFEKAGDFADVNVECELRHGPVIDEIIDFAELEQVALIVMGASHGRVIDMWVGSEVRDQTSIPVLILPYQVIGKETVNLN